MAGDWLKFEIATPDKEEVWSIADTLDIDPDAVVGKLLRVWIWFDQHTETGNARSVTKKLLDREVGVNGFCDSMISEDWMYETDGYISLPNFDRHNGKTAKNRAVTAKRVAKHKKSNAKGNDANDKKVTHGALPSPLPKEEEEKKYSSSSSFSPSPRSRDDRERFAMHLGWKPNFDQMTQTALEMAGLTSSDMENQLKKYIAAKIDDSDDHRTQHDWNKTFKNSLMKFALSLQGQKPHEKNRRTGKSGFNASTSIAADAIASHDPNDTF